MGSLEVELLRSRTALCSLRSLADPPQPRPPWGNTGVCTPNPYSLNLSCAL